MAHYDGQHMSCRYKHMDMLDLEQKLMEAEEAGAKVKLIATDGVFSMDGHVSNVLSVIIDPPCCPCNRLTCTMSARASCSHVLLGSCLVLEASSVAGCSHRAARNRAGVDAAHCHFLIVAGCPHW